MSEPPRLLDDPSTQDMLRAGLEAGRAERPSAAQLESLAAKLGPLLGPGGGGGPPVDPRVPMKLTLGAKTLGGLALVGVGVTTVAIVAGIFFGPLDDPAPPSIELPPPAPQPAPVVAEAEEFPLGVEVPDTIQETPLQAPAPQRPRRPAYEVDPVTEIALIERAQDALRSSPAQSLQITAEHERRFGPGTLAQEREVVAIDALHRLGQEEAATSRATRFRTAWPRSAHLRRIDVILGRRGATGQRVSPDQ